MAMLSFCGIDVSKDRLDVVVLPEGWFFSVSNDTAGWAELVARLRPLTVSAIGLEPSGGYERGIIRALQGLGQVEGRKRRPEARHGIIIPDTAKEKPQEGEVIAVGPGGRDESGKLIPIDVKVGDRVLFGKWSGTEVKLDGVEYMIMKESDLMGVLVEAGGSRKAA